MNTTREGTTLLIWIHECYKNMFYIVWIWIVWMDFDCTTFTCLFITWPTHVSCAASPIHKLSLMASWDSTVFIGRSFQNLARSSSSSGYFSSTVFTTVFLILLCSHNVFHILHIVWTYAGLDTAIVFWMPLSSMGYLVLNYSISYFFWTSLHMSVMSYCRVPL